jgi:hypothetical protein
VTVQDWLLVVLVFSVGQLFGTTWTIKAVRSSFSRQAEERRRLNEEWSAVRTAYQQDEESSDDDLYGGIAVGNASASSCHTSLRLVGLP